MSTTIANKMITLGQANLRAFFLLMAMVFFLTGIVPQYLDYFDYKKIELAENQESDREAEEKESKEEDDLIQILSNKSWYPEETTTFYESFSYWYCSYLDIITPPPELV